MVFPREWGCTLRCYRSNINCCDVAVLDTQLKGSVMTKSDKQPAITRLKSMVNDAVVNTDSHPDQTLCEDAPMH